VNDLQEDPLGAALFFELLVLLVKTWHGSHKKSLLLLRVLSLPGKHRVHRAVP
jgi:hypothetical protein